MHKLFGCPLRCWESRKRLMHWQTSWHWQTSEGKLSKLGVQRRASRRRNWNWNKYLFYCLITPPCGGPTPEIDPYERQTHNWLEPKALRLEKEKKNFVLRVRSMVAFEKLVWVHSRVHSSSTGRVVQELGSRWCWRWYPEGAFQRRRGPAWRLE